MLLPQTTGEVVESDLDWFFRRDGSMFPVTYVSVPLEMSDGRGAVVAFTDIEDRRRAEQVLREHDAVLASREGSLRRIATLVAGGAASTEVFAAIAREVAGVLGVSLVAVWRYESDGTGTVVGAWSEPPHLLETGSRWPLDDTVIISRVRETGHPARSDDLADVHGTVADIVREGGIRSAAGAPIVVDGDVWGVMAAGGTHGERLPDRIEDRLAEFTELVATTISNSEARSDLAASRARIVAATDEERRRVVRDLHDGAQQRLVHTVITLKLARQALQNERGRCTCACDRGARPGRARERRAARARARHPPCRPHPGRAARGRAGAGLADAAAGRNRRVRGIASPPRSRRPPTSSQPRR